MKRYIQFIHKIISYVYPTLTLHEIPLYSTLPVSPAGFNIPATALSKLVLPHPKVVISCRGSISYEES